MKKFLTTLAVLTAFAAPAFAQSFDPDAGTGNVLSFVASNRLSRSGCED
jgi:Tfp pilus assembly protein FimT